MRTIRISDEQYEYIKHVVESDHRRWMELAKRHPKLLDGGNFKGGLKNSLAAAAALAAAEVEFEPESAVVFESDPV